VSKLSAKQRMGKYTVFLSHSNRDAWLARTIKEKIERANPRANVWLDEMSQTGGDEIIAALKRGIRTAREVVVIVSNESLRSQWVAWELGMAFGAGKRITPLLNNVDHDAMAPLKGVKSYELNQFERFLLEFKRRSGRK
jgi:predicted nucleotide-binding protein